MAFVYGIEMQSIIDNYLEYKGFKKRLNLIKLFTGWAKKPELSDAIENKDEEK